MQLHMHMTYLYLGQSHPFPLPGCGAPDVCHEGQEEEKAGHNIRTTNNSCHLQKTREMAILVLNS